MKFKNRTAILLASSTLLGSTVVAFSATSANAAGRCGGIDVVTNNSSAYGLFTKDVTLRDRPYAECSSAGRFSKDTLFYYWCAKTNDHSNTWYYGRVANTNTKGYVYSGNIRRIDGTIRQC